MAKKKAKSAYAAAGVDIDEMMDGLSAVKRMVRSTAVKGSVGGIGAFGGLFESPGKGELLVASTDGVGTRLNVAVQAGRHDTVGQCLVNHCTNDILVQGAKPLFFMDYVGAAKLTSAMLKEVVSGLCRACRQNGCALLGGETAEMPGLYPDGEYDLVGTIVGSVPRRRVITGEAIRPGDVLIGLPSTGLHTNGYSLARKVIFERAKRGLGDRIPGSRQTVEQALLAVHRSYLKPVTSLLESVPVRGMAHITGGGLVDNVPRVLPAGTGVTIDRSSWRVPPLFAFIQDAGRVAREEMYRVFNMGIGYVIIVRPGDLKKTMTSLRAVRSGPRVIGEVTRCRKGGVTFTD